MTRAFKIRLAFVLAFLRDRLGEPSTRLALSTLLGVSVTRAANFDAAISLLVMVIGLALVALIPEKANGTA